jgi:putative salt-induced outer membrane protein
VRLRSDALIRCLLAALLSGAVSLVQAQEDAAAAPAEEEEAAPAPEEEEAAPAPEEEAAEPPPEAVALPDKGEWSGEVGAGFLSTDGNAQSRSVNGKFATEYQRERWKNTLQGSVVNSSSTTGQAAERYQASDKVDYQIYEQNYGFVVGEYEKDLFGGTRERASAAVGVGRHFLTGPRHLLDLEIGGGQRRTEEQLTGAIQDEAIARGSGKYEWKFTDKNSFTQTARTESGATNSLTESVSALKVAIIGNLSSSISYTARYNSSVPPDRDHVDSETALNLVYDFGRKK